MKTWAICTVWTEMKVVQAATEEAAYVAAEPEPREGLNLCNWHAIEVSV